MFVSKIYCKLALYVNHYSVFRMTIGVLARGGEGWGEGGYSPPKFWATQFFGQQEKIWAKPDFKEVSMFI